VKFKSIAEIIQSGEIIDAPALGMHMRVSLRKPHCLEQCFHTGVDFIYVRSITAARQNCLYNQNIPVGLVALVDVPDDIQHGPTAPGHLS
jgi:hypothetical protein